MAARFTEDDIESNECLVEHQPSEKEYKLIQWSFVPGSLTILAVIGIIEMIVLIIIFSEINPRNHLQPLLGELNHLVPNFSTRQVLFRTDPSATIDHKDEESRKKTRENWLSYIPKGNGFIDVNNTENYILPRPILYEGKQTYSMAVFHQLHCLYAIMDMYNSLTIPTMELDSTAHHTSLNISSDYHGHIQHCFRYLRQSIMCCGDTALEGQILDSNVSGTDGTGAVHVCKDFEAIREWAEGNRLIDTKHP
ncbi:hypothetical protein V8C42DRAFT_92219 [Trichoderma barbatum]